MSNIIICNIALFDSVTTERIQMTMNELAVIAENRRALRFPPHFTLRFRYEIPESRLKDLVSETKLEIKKLDFPIDFVAKDVSYTPWNAVYLDFDVPDDLQRLHERVMEIGQKYRTPYISDDYLHLAHFTDKQREYINKYGYHQAFEYFRPHITLAGGKIEPERMEEVKKYQVPMPIKGKINKVAFYRMEGNDSWRLCAEAN